MRHEFSLSPAGALTSKPFAFVARPWELVTIPSADVLDSFMGSVRLDLRGSEILRVLPLINESLNEEWLTDKARFSYDGLKRQRIISPYVSPSNISSELRFTSLINLNFRGRLKKLTVPFKHVFFQKLCSLFPSSSVGTSSVTVSVGKEVDLESAVLWDGMLRSVFRSVFYRLPDLYSPGESSFLYRVDQSKLLSSRFVTLVGVNLRWESPLLNIKFLRKSRGDGKMILYSCGVRPVSNLDSVNIGSNANKFLGALIMGRTKFLRGALRLNRDSYMLFHSVYAKVVHQLHQLLMWSFHHPPTISIFSAWASNQGYVELLGGTPYLEKNASKSDLMISLNADSTPPRFAETKFSIGYFTHGNTAHNNFDLVVPTPAYSEISCHYLNMFGYERYARFGTQILGEAVPSWFSFLKDFLALKNNFFQRFVYTLSSSFSYANIVSTPFEEDYAKVPFFKVSVSEYITLALRNNFAEVVPNYYRTHYVTRASKAMALASTRFKLTKANF